MRQFAMICMVTMIVAGCGKEEVAVVTAPPPPVKVVLPVEKPVQEFDEYTGRVEAVESVEIRSRVGGYVQTIGFKDGDEVKKGQTLFQIDPRPYQAALDAAKAALDGANASFAYAKDELARIEPVAKTGAVSAQELEKARDQYAIAEAKIAGAKAEIEARQLDMDYSTVKSPIDGRISKSNFSVGNLIGGDTLLTTVVSIHPTYVNFDIDEKRLLTYRQIAKQKGQDNLTRIREANMPVWVAMVNQTDFPFQGVLEFVDNQVDKQTGTIRARAEFNNEKRQFIPGQFVRVRTARGEPAKALLVPERAVSRDQDRYFILTLDEKDIVQYRNVTVGGVNGDMRVIASGLSANERVIVDGIQRARPGKPVAPSMLGAEAPGTQPATQTNH